MFKKQFSRDSTSWKTRATEEEEEEERGAKEGREREVPGLGKARGSPGNPDVRGAAAAAREGMVCGGKVRVRAGTTGVRGPGREQEARLLKLGRDGGELGDSGADDVADGIVTEDPVTSTTQGVVTPAIENFTAEPADGVTFPDRHAKTTLHGHAEERRRNVRVREQAPAPGARQASK